MFPAGFYQVNYRALRFREIVRMVGLPKAFSTYLATRFRRPDNFTWMPGLWHEIECRQEDLSEYIWQGTKPHREEFEKLGFIVCRYSKITRNLNPNLRDTGGVTYLDSSRCYMANLLYHRLYAPANGSIRNIIVIAFTAVFEQGCLSCTNNKNRFDPLDRDEVIQLNSRDVHLIYQQFLLHVQRRQGQPREFPTLESLGAWSDERQVRRFEERVRRRLFIPMTEKQVEAAKRRLDGPPAPPKQSSMRATIIWLIIIATAVSLRFLRVPLREGTDTITDQGQEFKMAKPFPTYEDYKDDPNNLDTNELGRIEQAMTTAKVPKVFKDRKEFVHVLIFDLTFPGYGLGGLGETPKADDGSTLDVEEIEIPQRDKSRYLVVRESPDHWDLVDDFVASTATNAITHVQLVSHTLRYYDAHGNLVREQRL
jgi:hypothetical protein